MAEADSQETGPSEVIVANFPEEQKPLVCIEYPGFVDNVHRAIASLGGTQAISQAHSEKNSVLELRFRPEDVYCKPAVARSTQVTNIVLRVRRRRRRQREPGERQGMGEEGGGEKGGSGHGGGGGEGGEGGGGGGGGEGEGSEKGEDQHECSVEVLGLVKSSYNFPAMADFQALPPGLSRVTSSAEPVDPTIFQLTEPFDESFQSSQVPLFLPPRLFSKFDKPSNYALRPDMKPKTTENHVAGKARQRRQVFAIGIPFNHKGSIPIQPHPDVPDTNHPKLSAIKQLFEERPVWSRVGIQSRIKLNDSVTRSLLALISYYFTSGPWKTLWVKLGYDPRSAPASKVYQCLDFRVPKDLIWMVETKRKRFKIRTAPQEQKRLFQLTGDQEDSVRLAEEKWAEGISTEPDESPVFTTERLPTQRQLYYQLCDLNDESLQAIVHCNDGREEECTEVNGWCREGAYEDLRKTLVKLIRRTAERVKAEQVLTEHTTAAGSSHSTASRV